MIVWLASYPRSGNSLLQTILKGLFGLQTHEIYPPFFTDSGNDKLREIGGHADKNLDLSEAAVSDHTYFIKTHDPPQDHAKAIYIVRDGRSAIVSYCHFLKDFTPEWKFSIEDVVMGDSNFGSWTDHFKAWAPKQRSNTLLLRYEDMVCNPSCVIKTIAEFLELPVLSLEIPSFTELQAFEPRYFRSGSDSDNVAELQGEALDLFWFMHGELLVELAYVDRVPAICDPAGIARRLRSYVAKLRGELAVSEADRAARLDGIRKLVDVIHKLDADLAARLDLIHELDAYVMNLQGELAVSEADRAALRRSRLHPVAYLMLCAAIVVLRDFVDAPPFDEMNSLLQICLLGAAMMWGGLIAAIAAFLVIVGIDFFLIDPVFALGIQDWRGLIELALGSVLALGFGISASRVFPSLLDDPSHSLDSN